MKRWWWKLLRYAKPHKAAMAGIAVLMLLGIGLQLLAPWPLKVIVDYVLPGEPLPAYAEWIARLPGAVSPAALIAWLAFFTVFIFLAVEVTKTVKQHTTIGTGNRMIYALGADLFDELQRISLRFHGRKPSGDLVRRVTKDTQSVKALVFGILLPVATAGLTLVAMFTIMWGLDWMLALVALATVPFLFVLMKVLYRPMEQRTALEYEAEAALMSQAEQALSALPAIQAFGREGVEVERFKTRSDRTIRARLRALASQLQFKIGVGAVTALGTALVMFVGGWRVLQGEMPLGSLLVFLAYLVSLYAPIESLAYMSSSVAQASAGAKRVLEYIGTHERVVEKPDAQRFPMDHDRRVRVEYRNVSFGYAPEAPVLSNVSFVAEPGTTTAIVGRTGSGKTTLASLLLRFMDPWEGEILVNGVDLRDIRLESLRRNIGIVLQEPFLLPLSIAENIAYGRPQATLEEIEAAAVAAHADEFIETLPDGYDTELGERGVRLSIGQRQRISIARALLKDAPILILDEPTSALDAETEARVMDAIRLLKEGRTTFVIAHREVTVRNSNLVLNLAGTGESLVTGHTA